MHILAHLGGEVPTGKNRASSCRESCQESSWLYCSITGVCARVRVCIEYEWAGSTLTMIISWILFTYINITNLDPPPLSFYFVPSLTQLSSFQKEIEILQRLQIKLQVPSTHRIVSLLNHFSFRNHNCLVWDNFLSEFAYVFMHICNETIGRVCMLILLVMNDYEFYDYLLCVRVRVCVYVCALSCSQCELPFRATGKLCTD